jgi:hypothetical protein
MARLVGEAREPFVRWLMTGRLGRGGGPLPPRAETGRRAGILSGDGTGKATERPRGPAGPGRIRFGEYRPRGKPRSRQSGSSARRKKRAPRGGAGRGKERAFPALSRALARGGARARRGKDAPVPPRRPAGGSFSPFPAARGESVGGPRFPLAAASVPRREAPRRETSRHFRSAAAAFWGERGEASSAARRAGRFARQRRERALEALCSPRGARGKRECFPRAEALWSPRPFARARGGRDPGHFPIMARAFRPKFS